MQVIGLSGAIGPSIVPAATEHAESRAIPSTLSAFRESLRDVDLSPAADERHARVTAMTEKASRIQAMLEALQGIIEVREGLQDYADALSMKGGLFSMGSLRDQIRAFVKMLLQYREEQRRLAGIVPGLAEGFRAKDVMRWSPEDEGLTTQEGIQRYLESMRERIESLSSYEIYLEEQMRLLVSETQELEMDIISAMKADGELNEALAMNLASVASEQLLKGFDILLGVDSTQEKSRIAKLLQMDTQQV